MNLSEEESSWKHFFLWVPLYFLTRLGKLEIYVFRRWNHIPHHKKNMEINISKESIGEVISTNKQKIYANISECIVINRRCKQIFQ